MASLFAATARLVRPATSRVATRCFAAAAAEEPAAPAAKPARKRRKLAAALTLTEGAAVRIREMMEDKEGAVGVRLGVRTRGCNGMSYTLNYAMDGEAGKLDEVVDQHGVKVVVDGKALFHVIGTTMDWEETALSAEFVFTNPNAKGECGCGESFNV